MVLYVYFQGTYNVHIINIILQVDINKHFEIDTIQWRSTSGVYGSPHIDLFSILIATYITVTINYIFNDQNIMYVKK